MSVCTAELRTTARVESQPQRNYGTPHNVVSMLTMKKYSILSPEAKRMKQNMPDIDKCHMLLLTC